MDTQVHKVGDAVRVVHEPGNGTRYEAVAVMLPADFPQYGGMWLISFPLLHSAHFFHGDGFLSVSYVAEKLGRDQYGSKIADVDLHEMTKIISTITGRANNAAADEKGRLPALRVAQ